MSDTVAVTVGSDLVKPIVEAKIQAAIVAALGQSDRLINDAVNLVLHRKVDSQGQYTTSDYRSTPYIEWLCTSVLQCAVKAAVEKWVAANTERIEAALAKEMKMNANTFAKAFTKGFAEGMAGTWRTQFNVSFSNPKD
jgi:hypothetical protein